MQPIRSVPASADRRVWLLGIGGALLTTAVLGVSSSREVAPGVLLAFVVVPLLALIAMGLILRALQRRGLLTNRCLVIGTNAEARRVLALIELYPDAGIQVVGLVDSGGPRGRAEPRIHSYPVLGTEAALHRLIRRYRIDRLIVAAPCELQPLQLRRLQSFRYRSVAVTDYGSLHEELTRETSVDDINDEWLLAASLNHSRPHIRRAKRLFDLFGALVGLVLASPLAALTALLIKLDSAGPVLYRQARLGRGGVAFTILKFRTMAVDAESETGPVWASASDPRVTRVGRWLRRFRVDELPQLINVLRGEMSLIGPRPERAIFVKQLAAQIPFYAERLTVQPGITGWAQVSQFYAASVEESRRKLQADLYYIKHMSFPTDLYILLKTVQSVLLGRERGQPSMVSGNARSLLQATPASLAAVRLPV